MDCIEHRWFELNMEFGGVGFFYDLFGLCEQRGQVGKVKQIVFEIRTKEQGHNTPHLHAYYENENISISLVDYTILAGNIPAKQQRLAVEWTRENIEKLRSKWNEYHRYTLPVMGDKVKSND